MRKTLWWTRTLLFTPGIVCLGTVGGCLADGVRWATVLLTA